MTEMKSPHGDPHETVSPEPPEAAHPPVPDLRTARVLEARDHPNADRLLVMRIDLGSEERQIVAGIVGHYEPAELVGKPIVVVTNLQHAKLRGEVSQGMLLAAENAEGRLGLLLAPEAAPGTPVKVPDGPAPDQEITFQGFHENTLLAGPGGVTLNGAPLEGTPLIMDREVYGRLR
jgi:methionine--tRNA ligase beta chain